MNKHTALALLIFLIILPQSATSQPQTLWTQLYGGDQEDFAYDVDLTEDGGYIVAGFAKSFGAGDRDVYLVKTDSLGNELWSQYYGGDLDEVGRSVDPLSDGGYMIAGWTSSFGPGDCSKWILRADELGDTLWTQIHGSVWLDKIFEMQPVADGSFISAGFQNYPRAYNNDAHLLKTDADGDSIWSRHYGGEGVDKAFSVAPTMDGGYVLAGFTGSFGYPDRTGYVVRTDSSGDALWTRYMDYVSNPNWFNSIQQTADGGYVAAGSIYNSYSGETYYRMYLVRLSANGEIEWERQYGDFPYWSQIYAIKQTQDGGFIIAGKHHGTSQYVSALVRTDSQGNVLWTQTFGDGQSEDELHDVEILPGGYYVCAGIMMDDMCLIKIQEPVYCCEVEMYPDEDPIIVQPGGSFAYNGALLNPSTESQISDVWVGVVHEGEFIQLQLFPGTDSLRSYEFWTMHITQNVPDYAPVGNYRYAAYCGNHPSACDSAWFDFTVTGPSLRNGSTNWSVSEDMEESANIPTTVTLSNNYPNPFNAQTTITYQLPEAGNVNLDIYNLVGQRVATLENSYKESGEHSVSWDASSHSSGVYFYKLENGDEVITKRMTLLK